MKTKPVSATKWRCTRFSLRSTWRWDEFIITREYGVSGCRIALNSGSVTKFYHGVTPTTARAIIDGRRVGKPDRIVSDSEALLRLAVAKAKKEGALNG